MVCHQNTLGESILGFLDFILSKDRMSCVAFGRDVQSGRSRFTPGRKTYFFLGKIGQNHLDEGPEWRKRKNTLSLETRDYLEVNFNFDRNDIYSHSPLEYKLHLTITIICCDTWSKVCTVCVYTSEKIIPVCFMLRLNVSLQCSMVSKLPVEHVTVICVV